MSGTRDYKTLLSSHRQADHTVIGQNEEKNKLTLRMLNGVQSNKYKPVDYDALKSKAQEMKFNANKGLIKMKKIEQAAKDTKEKNLLKQHHSVWFKELSNLNALKRRNLADIDLHIKNGCDMEEVSHLFGDIEEFSSQLQIESTLFKKNTVDPIYELHEDLKYWIAQVSAERISDPATAGEDLGSPDEIMETIVSVKSQQDEILQKLHNDRLSLEQELDTGLLHDIKYCSERLPQNGIPSEAVALECPDESLKVSILQEFLLIDQKYMERLELLDEQYHDIVSYEYGGWSEDEHFEFQAILDQHPFDLHHRRHIYIDRMKRQWPNKSRADIVDHEDWVWKMRNYRHNRKSLINDWYRDRKELLVKAEAVFYEALMEHQLLEAQSERVKQQQELCEMLYKKVKEWREEKMEAMMIRQRLLDDKLQEAKRLRLEEEEKLNKKRAQEKEKIKERHKKLAEEQKRVAELDQIRLDELQKRHAEQAKIDAERVQHRQKLEIEKQVALQVKKEQEIVKDQEKEARLEALREKVRVVAEPDPYRMIKDTENWQNRRRPNADITFNINQPLFDINTFNSSQIASDPRVKLETKLRQAGLHNTDYARHIMSKTEPIKPTRKDTIHTLKFGD